MHYLNQQKKRELKKIIKSRKGIDSTNITHELGAGHRFCIIYTLSEVNHFLPPLLILNTMKKKKILKAVKKILRTKSLHIGGSVFVDFGSVHFR